MEVSLRKYIIFIVFWSIIGSSQSFASPSLDLAANEAYKLISKGEYRQAEKRLLMLSVKGSANASFYLGEIFSNGQTIDPKLEDAIYWYGKALKQGHQEAKHRLNTILIDAIENYKSNLALKALDAGADKNTTFGKRKTTVLSQAARYGNFFMVTELIKRGADVNKKSSDGVTALSSALKKSLKSHPFLGVGTTRYDIVNALLEAKANPNSYHGRAQIPLLQSAIIFWKTNPELLELLVKHGADINASDKNGNTALMIAAVRNYPELASLLLEHGAGKTTENKQGKTALDLAVKRKNNQVINILER